MATELTPRQAFERLAAILGERKLDWIVTQVRDQIRSGKPTVRRVKELRPTNQSATEGGEFRRDEGLKPGREVQFRTTVEFTEEEQLELLLAATRQAILNAAAIEDEVRHRFPGLVFISEQAEDRIVVPPSETPGRSKALRQFQIALNELSKALAD